MVSYKFYEDTDFNISDGEIIIDLDNDIDGDRHPVIIMCDDGEILIELEFNVLEGFIDPTDGQGKLNSCDGPFHLDKVRRIRLNANEDNSSYRIWGGLT